MSDGIPANTKLELPVFFSTRTDIADGSRLAVTASLSAGSTVLAQQSGSYTFRNLHPSISFNFRSFPVEDKWEYWTGEELSVYVDYYKGAGSGSITDGRIRFLMDDATYVTSFRASEMSSATSMQLIKDSKNRNIGVDHYFSSMNPGIALSIPMVIDSRDYFTPDNYKLNMSIVVEERAADGSYVPVTEVTTGSITYQAVEPTLRKYHNTNRFYDYTPTFTTFGGFDQDGDGRFDPGGDSLQRFDFHIFLPNSTGLSSGAVGGRAFGPITIIDTLPAGAAFDPAVNPGWSYVPGSNNTQVQYTKTSLTYASVGSSANTSIPLYLSFPGFQYKDVPIKNTAQALLTPWEGQPGEYSPESLAPSDDITLYLSAAAALGEVSKSVSPSSLPDQLYAKQDTEFQNNLALRNPSTDMSMNNVVLDDYALDARLKFTKVKLYTYYTNQMTGPDGQVGSGRITIQALDANDGLIAVVADSISTADGAEYAVPENTVKLRIKADDGTLLPPGKYLYAFVYTRIREPEKVNYVATPSVANIMYNSVKAYYGWDGYTVKGESLVRMASTRLTPYAPTIYISKTMSMPKMLMNDISTVQLIVMDYGRLQYPDTINGLRLMDLLPKHVEYVPQSLAFNSSYGNNPDNQNILLNKEPIIVPNYRGTERTALI